MLVAETDDGKRVGFLHLQTMTDFFSGGMNCHISDLAVAKGWDGKGIGRALLLACLHAMAADGYAYGVIGWVHDEAFYRRAVGAIPIAGSEPGFYQRLLGR